MFSLTVSVLLLGMSLCVLKAGLHFKRLQGSPGGVTGGMIGTEKPNEEIQVPHVLGEGGNEESGSGAAKGRGHERQSPTM